MMKILHKKNRLTKHDLEKNRFVRGLSIFLFLGLAACQANQAQGDSQLSTAGQPDDTSQLAASSSANEAASESPDRILTTPVPSIEGPKRVVAVGKADAIGSFKQQYGDWDIGGGVGAMLTTALKESDRFIVLERANVSQILAEQELKGNKLTHQGSGPKLGGIIGVNFLIYLSVTEFSTDDEGGGLSLGLSGGGLGSLLSGALSRQSKSGKVAMDLRVVDTTTSEVLEIYKVSEKIENSGWDASVGYSGVSFGGNQFMKTPLGQAVRAAVNRAVGLIARKANEVPWNGHVVDVDEQEVYINAGRSAGIQVGDKYSIERISKVFTDPATGKVLGTRKKTLGTLEVTGVEEKLAYGVFLPLARQEPARGDLVIMMGGGS